MLQKAYKFWFLTGSQDLYGDECLAHVAEHSQIIVEKLNASGALPYALVWKPTLITDALIRQTFNEANADPDCAGVITWDAHLLPGQELESRACASTASRFCTCTRSSTRRSPTTPSTWTS